MSVPSQNKRRVLFVDDDPRLLELMSEVMAVHSRGEWDILTADNASRAFALLQEHPADLAVVDVEMPVMDGVQMISLLHRGYPNVQKVALAGRVEESTRAACLANGAELYLEKPTTPDGWQNIFTVLNELLKSHSETGFRGVLRRVGIEDVIQMECLGRSSSLLEITTTKLMGQIFISEGAIVHAQIGDLKGEEAFNKILSLRGGQFNLKPFAEPPVRTIQGQWEMLLMESARQRDEAQANAQAEAPPSVAEIEKAAEEFASPASRGTEPRPVIDEVLICSGQGDVLHEWQCRDVALWLKLLEFISQKSQRLAQGVGLGDFDRLEIVSDDSRTVIVIGPDRGVVVRSHRELATN